MSTTAGGPRSARPTGPSPIGHPALEVAVVGARIDVVGFALAGAHVVVADDDASVRAAWRHLPPGVGIVLLTSSAATALADETADAKGPLTAVIP